MEPKPIDFSIQHELQQSVQDLHGGGDEEAYSRKALHSTIKRNKGISTLSYHREPIV